MSCKIMSINSLYKECIDNNYLAYKQATAIKWNLEKVSIAQANALGYWLVTEVVIIEGLDGIELPFKFLYSERYMDEIIAMTYNFVNDKTNGIPFT